MHTHNTPIIHVHDVVACNVPIMKQIINVTGEEGIKHATKTVVRGRLALRPRSPNYLLWSPNLPIVVAQPEPT